MLLSKVIRFVPCAVVQGAALSGIAAAGQQAPVPLDRPVAVALALHGAAPVIDGVLDESIWRGAPSITGLVQRFPQEGEPASERTEVWIRYDDEALYIGARMHKSDPASLSAPLTRRDHEAHAERLLISLDSYRDRRTAYTFGVTAAGTRLDWYHPTDAETARDLSFDPVWTARVQHDSAGWTAEMRIPFSQLRFTAEAEHRWGINVARFSPTLDEESYWVMVPPRETGWASRFGDLIGIAGIRPSRRVELLPYVANSAAYRSSAGKGNPFSNGGQYRVRGGGDLKMGLGPNLTLEATINPDFGQVEADPAQVNLSAFETFFPEQRPFFTEGSQLFSAGNYFYSRRIGAAPPLGQVHGVADRVVGEYSSLEEPENTTILGATKLTGRLASGSSLGALVALTGAKEIGVLHAASGLVREVRVAPTTTTGVMRAQQEVGGSGSTVGAVFTAVERALSDDDPLRAYLHERAYSGAVDWSLRFRGGEYVLKGDAGFSSVYGDSAAVQRTQRSAARYFQRPDAKHLTLDSSRTALSGYRTSLGLARERGTHWLWSTSLNASSPGFELNDAGAMGLTDRVSASGMLTYRETRPRGLLRDYSLELESANQWNFDGDRILAQVSGFARSTLMNYWRTSVGGWIRLPVLNDRATWGGPLLGTGEVWRFVAGAGSPSNRSTRGRLQLDLGGGTQGDTYVRSIAGVTFLPAPRWQLSVDQYLTRWSEGRQFVGALPGGSAATFGTRYVFSHIDRSELSLQLRAAYLITPELSLESYVEPYAASGKYRRFGELPSSRSRTLRFYDEDGITLERVGDEYVVTDGGESFTLPFADFNLRSFRSNTVLRWEWRPGSTLYAVWQQNRWSIAPHGDPVGPASALEALRSPGDNYLILKVSYWIPLR